MIPDLDYYKALASHYFKSEEEKPENPSLDSRHLSFEAYCRGKDCGTYNEWALADDCGTYVCYTCYNHHNVR